MKIGGPCFFHRSILLAAACILAVVMTACTGRGGGQLPPGAGFTGAASFGFTFSCQKGDLKIELSYNDKGSNPIGSSFGIHGIVDKVDPVLESEICIGEEPPPGGNELIFLGRYYLTSSAPSLFPSTCRKSETSTSPLCRFEVIVQDNDKNLTPSQGDSFAIKLSSSTALSSQLPAPTVFYARAGTLSSGNLTVD